MQTSAQTDIPPFFTKPTMYVADVDRYVGGAFDKTQDIFWTYTTNKILRLRGRTGNKLYTLKQVIGNTNERIEKLCYDSIHRNIFLKTTNQIYCADPLTMKSIPIQNNINLKDARIDVYRDLLIVYGNFGIAFYKIRAKNQLSAPIIYNNAKEIHYSKVLSNVVAGGKVIMQTDNGLYEITIPNDNEYNKGQKK